MNVSFLPTRLYRYFLMLHPSFAQDSPLSLSAYLLCWRQELLELWQVEFFLLLRGYATCFVFYGYSLVYLRSYFPSKDYLQPSAFFPLYSRLPLAGAARLTRLDSSSVPPLYRGIIWSTVASVGELFHG